MVPLLVLRRAMLKQFRNRNKPQVARETIEEEFHSTYCIFAGEKTVLESIEEPIVKQHYSAGLELRHHGVRD
jgi:hypothetical protein